MKSPQSSSRAVAILRWAAIAAGLSLPLLSLVPLGSLWLWQNGWLLWWGLAACSTTAMAWALQAWLLRGVRARPPPAVAAPASVSSGPDPGWTPAEAAAWRQVSAIAETARVEDLTSRDAVIGLGLRTVEAVARSLHPEKSDPLWQFTAPEALALVERVAQRMRVFIDESVPLGDRLTISQGLQIYRWRGAVGMAEKAYDVWRAVRLLNPATALASEVRERLQKEMTAIGKDYVGGRLARAFVEEVGRAAIDLYGGRLAVAPERLAGHVTAATAADRAAAGAALAEPLRILVAGQVSTGKSSLVNALASEVRAAVDALPATAGFAAYELKREGLTPAQLIDSPGLDAAEGRARLIEQASQADLVIWVLAASRADREADRAALAELRRHFAERPNRRRPPLLAVLSHIDRLRPFQEWGPPYDLVAGTSAKAVSIRDAVRAAAQELAFEPQDIIPACLESGRTYNVDAIWSKITELLPEAQRAQLIRTLRDAAGSRDWHKLWSQVVSGGRVLGRTVVGR